MPSPRTPPEPKPSSPPKKPTIFTFNATNPDFVPGYSVLRVEQAKRMPPEDKTRLMSTIVDDLVASVSLINEYHRNGVLSDENISQVSTMMQSIRENNKKVDGQRDEKIERLKRERRQVQRDYRELAQQMEAMGQKYADKVQGLEGEVVALKEQIAWMEAGHPLRQPQNQLGENFDRRCVSEEEVKIEACDGQEQMGEDEADGKWEEEKSI